METPEEFVASNDHQILHRNKRNFTLISGGAAGGADHHHHHHHHATSSSSSSVISGEISTEEEEDMANCLILLAQGHPSQILQPGLKIDTISSKRFNFQSMAAKTSAEFYVYECKTCNRTFPSFQALGGHRASHKKPKMITATAATATEELSEEAQLNKNIAPVAVQIQSKTVAVNFQAQKGGKIHECSICGLEFTSGQALGGHMRRHRTTVAVSTTQQQQQIVATKTEHNHNHNHHHNSSSATTVAATIIKQRNILELDLNLPAPEEDHVRETKFQFTATPQTIVFAAPTLVDCHY